MSKTEDKIEQEMDFQPPADFEAKVRNDWEEITWKAKQAPGDWFYVGLHSPSVVTRIRKRQMVAFRDGVWEAISRKAGKNKAQIYISYLGKSTILNKMEKAQIRSMAQNVSAMERDMESSEES